MTQPIKNLLQNIFSEKSSWKINLLKNWPTIIGSLNTKVNLEKVYENTLVLGVENACWLQELYLLSPLLIKTINEKLDQPRIKNLRFKQVSRKKNNKKQSKLLKKKSTNKIVSLSSTEKSALTIINDPQLEVALKNFLIRCYQEKEWK